MKKEDMIEGLVMYYEAAGFKDYYNKELKDKTEEEIYKLFSTTFAESNDEIF